jgi:polysaccharide export outer membrane protein
MVVESLGEQRRPPAKAVRYCRLVLLLLTGAGGLGGGCGDHIRQPSTEQLALFDALPSAGPAIDLERVTQAKMATGPYRVVPGDVLQVEMPRFLEPQYVEAAAPADVRQTYVCRVNDEGKIVLPIIGSLAVAGQSLARIESGIMAQYCPRYVKTQVPVYVSVLEYRTQRVSIVGAVTKPGIYALRHDQMSLVSLLMEAGSIVESGAARIRIVRADDGEAYVAGAAGSAATAAPGVRRIPPWVRAVFEPEGPLNTTGWLALQQGEDILARQWLDLGNEPQRQAFLQTAVARSRDLEAEGVRERLLYLAGYLESNPQHASRRPVPKSTGWRMADAGCFVASFPAEPGRHGGTAIRLAAQVPQGPENLVLPVRGLNIPFADVTLGEGDSVIVEGPSEQYVSVVGLVARPGNMPYLPNAHYTLIQAIAFAGGLDLVADPRYVSVYRLQSNGEVAGATCRLVNPKRQEQLTQALALPLQPGDVVSVEHTPRTRTNVFFDRIFRISLGLYFSPNDIWGS